MIKTMISSMISPMIQSMVNPDSGALQRIFINNDEAAGAFYSLATPIVMAGDFSASIEFSTTSILGTGTLLSGVTSSSDTIILDIQSNGRLRLFAFVGGSLQTIITTTASYNDGVLYTAHISYTGTAANLTIGLVDEGSATWALDGNQTISFSGARAGSSSFFDGILANPIFNNAGTITSFNLDEATADIEYSNENTFGADVWSGQDFTGVNSGTVNIIISGQSWDIATATGSSGNVSSGGRVQTLTGLTVGQLYEVRISTDREINIAVYDADFSVIATSLGSGVLSFVASSTTRLYICPRDAITVQVSNVDIVDATGNVLTYENQALDQRELFTFTDGDWMGQELVVNGGFDTDSDWIKGVGWTISGGLLNTSTATNTNSKNSAAVVVGNTYVSTFDVVSLVSGKVELQGGYNGIDRTSVGSYSEVGVAVFEEIYVRANFSDGFVGSTDNVSVKRLIEIA